jgi:hypothetical protein
VLKLCCSRSTLQHRAAVAAPPLALAALPCSTILLLLLPLAPASAALLRPSPPLAARERPRDFAVSVFLLCVRVLNVCLHALVDACGCALPAFHKGYTRMNATSSRSHAIFTITVRQASVAAAFPERGPSMPDDPVLKVSKFHLVDLAGRWEGRALRVVLGTAQFPRFICTTYPTDWWWPGTP